MLNKCKINILTVTNQVGHFYRTTVVFGQVLDFHLLATKLELNHNILQHRHIIIIILIPTFSLLHGLYGFLRKSDF